LEELEKPQRVIQIVQDYERRKQREVSQRVVNPLRPAILDIEDIDDLYGQDESDGGCAVCHK